jgi:hypothetical protein
MSSIGCHSPFVDYEDTAAKSSPKLWLDHRHYRTYEIALGITRSRASADLRDLELCAPLVPAGRCPLFVRNRCYASTHGDAPRYIT